MNKKIISLIILFICHFAYSQDREPEQQSIKIDSIYYYISTNLSSFKQDRFLIGTIWESDYRLHNKIGFSSCEGHVTDWLGNNFLDPATLSSNSDYILHIPHLSNWGPWFPFKQR